MIVIFCFKDTTFSLLLAPSHDDFITYKWIESLAALVGVDFHFQGYTINLIATNLSSQFMMHITASAYLALLAASPYICYELFRFISPALYDNERRYSTRIVTVVYLLFLVGVLITYFLLFPIAVRFLGTYQVADAVKSTITIDSYIATFTTLTLLMGLVFQLPVIIFFLAKMGIVTPEILSRYRRHALVAIAIVSAIITPPDVMTLILVTVPMYLLYELSIIVARKVKTKTT